jgi:phosphonate transport system ATP-binding protein
MEFADRVIGIHAGRVVFEGRPDTLDAQALARIYPGLDGVALAEAEPKDLANRLAELTS